MAKIPCPSAFAWIGSNGILVVAGLGVIAGLTPNLLLIRETSVAAIEVPLGDLWNACRSGAGPGGATLTAGAWAAVPKPEPSLRSACAPDGCFG